MIDLATLKVGKKITCSDCSTTFRDIHRALEHVIKKNLRRLGLGCAVGIFHSYDDFIAGACNGSKKPWTCPLCITLGILRCIGSTYECRLKYTDSNEACGLTINHKNMGNIDAHLTNQHKDILIAEKDLVSKLVLPPKYSNTARAPKCVLIKALFKHSKIQSKYIGGYNENTAKILLKSNNPWGKLAQQLKLTNIDTTLESNYVFLNLVSIIEPVIGEYKQFKRKKVLYKIQTFKFDKTNENKHFNTMHVHICKMLDTLNSAIINDTKVGNNTNIKYYNNIIKRLTQLKKQTPVSLSMQMARQNSTNINSNNNNSNNNNSNDSYKLFISMPDDAMKGFLQCFSIKFICINLMIICKKFENECKKYLYQYYMSMKKEKEKKQEKEQVEISGHKRRWNRNDKNDSILVLNNSDNSDGVDYGPDDEPDDEPPRKKQRLNSNSINTTRQTGNVNIFFVTQMDNRINSINMNFLQDCFNTTKRDNSVQNNVYNRNFTDNHNIDTRYNTTNNNNYLPIHVPMAGIVAPSPMAPPITTPAIDHEMPSLEQNSIASVKQET